MTIDKKNAELGWISLILRLAMGLMFAIAAAYKFIGGYQNAVSFIIGSVKGSFLPVWLVTIYAYVLPAAEAVIAVWLLAGFQLQAAWVFTALTLVSLGLGLMAGQQSAADTYLFTLMACAGLYFSRYDNCCLGKSK